MVFWLFEFMFYVCSIDLLVNCAGCLIFCVDVVAIMIGISDQREYICDGKITKMILLELTDDR